MTNDLVATCWTHAGDAAPMRGDERSPFDILDRVRAAAAAGFSGIGFSLPDLLVARDTVGYPGLRAAIADVGMTRTEVELLGEWWATGEARQSSDVQREQLFEAASALGATILKVRGAIGDDPDHDVLVREWNALCEQAEAAGTRIALEALPFTSFRTIPDAARFVEEAGHPAGGLMIDAWHVWRAGNTPEDLRGTVPGRRVLGVELDDATGPTPPVDELFRDTVDRRLAPGDGDFDIVALVRVLRDIGFDGPWGVEILSEEQRQRSLTDALTIAARSGRRTLEAADRA